MNQTEPSLNELTWAELLARVARAQLYAIETGLTQSSVPDATLRDHLAYMHALDAAGRLFGWGPLEGVYGPTRELAIVAAASRDEAAAIAAGDPLIKGGLATSGVRAHTMNEGVACYVGRAISRRAEAGGSSFATNADISLAGLEVRRAGVPMQAVFLNPTTKPYPREDARSREAHFVWLRENEMAARLLSCGPLEAKEPTAEGVWGGGLGIFAVDRAEAEAIAAAEPSGVAGYRSLTVVGWRLDYGLAAPIAGSLRRLAELLR